ncbi:MAG TPA: thioredoxin-like domain-containing protein [Oleiagrimonas sp.]|nr:thioredoxin-like domain-containing protein [Oleiagrimonas sp.]
MAYLLRKLITTGTILMVLMLSACTGARAAPPPFPTSAPWFNVSRPLTWSDLEGRVVLLDFFTPGCINCIHMVPVEEKLAERFGPRLVIIGVDAPKFTDSGTVPGLKDFIAVHHVRHPVVLDQHQQIWKDWRAVAWPTFVLIGPDGKTRKRFIGEQAVLELAGPIKQALADAPPASSLQPLPLKAESMGGDMLNAPGGIAVAGKRVAISDTGHNRIVLATRAGKVTAVIGDGCAGGRNGGYAEARFSRPHGLSFHDGKLYVADTRGQKIRVVDLKSHHVTTLAGNGGRAYVTSGSFPATRATLNSPWDIQWVNGKLYVAMAGNHAIWRYDPATGQLGPWAGSGREGLRDGARQSAEFAQPSGMDAHAGTLYVAGPESSSVRAITVADGQVRTLIGEGLFSFGMRDGPAGQALLQHDEDVLWLDGSVYIADTFSDALRRLDLATGEVSTVTTDLDHPQALAVLSPTRLLVAESGGNRVDVVDLSTGDVSRWPLSGLKSPTCTGKTHDGSTTDREDSRRNASAGVKATAWQASQRP